MKGIQLEKLINLCSKVTDGTHDSPKPVVEGTPFIMGVHVKSGRIDFDNCLFLSEKDHQDVIKRSKPEKGDTLLANIGANVGETGYVNVDFEFSIKNLALFKPDFTKVDGRYLYYLLSSPKEQALLKNKISGSAQPFLSLDLLRNHKVNYHESLPTQRRIASILSAYDDMIENNLRRIRLLEELAQRTYEEWFVRFRVHGEALEVDEATGLPVGWGKVACIDAMEVMSGGTPKTDNESYWNGNIQFFTPKDASSFVYTDGTEKMVTEIGVKKCNSKLYPVDTVFITARGTVGKLNLASEPMAMNQSCYALKGKGYISQLFLYNSLFAAMEQFKAASNGGVFNTIVVDTFRYLPFVMPPQNLVEDFTQFVKPIYSQVKNLIAQNRLLREARDMLLPRLMGGEVEV